MNDDKLKKAYQSALKYYDLPDFETFKSDMMDENNLRRFRDNLSKHYDIPDFNTFKSDMGIVKKKETTVSPSVQKEKPISSGTQSKATQKPSGTSVSGKPEGLYSAPGNALAVFKKTADGWYVDNNRSGNFIKLQKGDVEKRVAALESTAKKFYDPTYEQKTSWQAAPSKQEVKPVSKESQITERQFEEPIGKELAQKAFEEEFFIAPKKGMSSVEQVDFVAREKAKKELGEGASEQDLINAEQKYKESGTLKMLQRKGYDVDINGSINDPKSKKALAEFNANEQLRLKAEAKQDRLSNSIDNIVSSKLMGLTEEQAVPQLNKQFGKYGFVFEESAPGVDAMNVRYSPDGITYTPPIEINLQSEDAEKQANILKTFMNIKYLNDSEVAALNDEKLDAKKLVKITLSDPLKYAEYGLSEGQFENYITSEYRNANALKIQIDNKLSNFNKLSQQYNTTGDENILNQLRDMESSIKNDQEKLTYAVADIEQTERKYKESVGSYILQKEKQGNFIGGLFASAAKGVTAAPKMLMNIGMDVLPEFLPNAGLNPLEYQKMKDEGFSDAQIQNKVSSELKRTIGKDINQGIANVGSLGTVQNEYFSSVDRNILEQAVFGLTESVGAATSGGGNAVAQGLAFFGMSYNAMQDELSSKEFDELDKWEKQAISGVYGLVIGQLEKIGFNMSAGQMKNPFLKNFTATVVKNALKDMPENATIETIDQLIGTSLKNTMRATGAKVVNGALSEGATEGIQSFAETTMKNIVNEIHDKKVFAYVPDLTTKKGIADALGSALYEAAAGAIGGAIMGSFDTYRQSRVNEQSDEKFQNMYQSLMDDNTLKAVKLNEIEKYKNGNISREQMQSNISEINTTVATLNKIPTELDTRGKRVAYELLSERDGLQLKIQGKDPNLVSAEINRIAEIDNQLKTIGENAVKESTKPVEEGPAEGGGIQYQGTQEGQPEVREGERPVGQAAQPEADLGDRVVEGRGAEEEARITRQVVNRPAVLSEFGGKTFDTPLKGDVYVEGQQVVFEDRSTGRVYELGNVDEVMDTQVPGLSVEQERVSITPEGKVSIEGGNWNIQSELPTQGIEYNPAGEVMTVSLKDDAGNTKMFKGQDAVDIAYQIELQKYQTEEQQQLINNLLEQDEEFQAATENIKPAEVAAVVQEEAAPDIVPTEPTVAEETINKEVDALEKLLKRQDPNFQLDSEITQEEKKEELVSKAIDKMSKSDISEMSEEAFEAEFPTPDVKTYPIEVKENSELASKLKRMGLKDLIGKKINLVMADQLKVGEVMGRKRMGGPFFPLIDKLFGKVAWASMNEDAANKIINGAVKSDYTVVYNMSTTAIDSNVALTETFEDLTQSLPKNKQKEIFNAIQEQVLKNQYGKKTDQVRFIAKSSKTLNDFFTELDKLDVDTISAVVKNIMPSRDVDAATKIGKLLQEEGITIETVREMNIEQFASNLPTGSLLMVLEVTDKSGRKVTKETAREALITPEQQDEEGLPKHNNYPIYVRGKAVALLNETVPFWNILKGSINNINTKIAGIVRQASGRKITSKEAISNEMRSASMTASVAKKVSEKINTQYNRFVSAISKSFPNVEVVASQEEFDALLNDLNTKKLSTKNAKVYGAVYKGKLYLNPSLENYNTPVHEFGHIWINTAKVASKELYNKGISLVKGSEYESNVRNNKEYQRVIKQMKADGASDIDIDNYIYEEALATAIGDKGESFVTASQRLDFKNWMRKLFSFVKSMTGISKYTSEQLEDITLDEFVQAVSVDIMSGTELFKGAKTNLSDALQLMTNGSNSIEYIMSVARDNGISDAAIKKYLSNQGFSEQEIKSAFKKQPKAPSVEKILGKPAPKKMIVNEAVALRDQLRLEARAARESAMDLKRKQRALVAVVNGMKRSGSINTTQATALAKRIVNTNIDNPVMVKRMLDYAGRLFQDAEYKNKLSNARSINKKIKSAIKSKDLQASVVAVAKDFSKIDPRLLEDIDRYIENATKVLDAVKRTRLPEMREAMNFDDINAYTEEANAEMEEYRKEEVKELNDQLLESIDTEGMTAAELMDLIRSLSDVDAALPSEKKRAIILDYINKVKDAYTPIVESIVKGTDPFTGDSIDTSKKAKELIGKLIDIDINKLDVREAVKVIDAINNFITNGITDNVESIVRTYEGQVNAQEIADSNMPIREAKLGGIARLWSEQMMNLPVLADWIFKSPKRAIQVLNKMGFTDFQNGVAKAVKNWTNYVDSYHNTFKKKKANGKNFMDAENIYERGVYAFLKRTVAGDEIAQQKEFERKVGLISKSIDVLKKQGSQKDLKVAEMYEQLMDKFELNKDGVTISDVESKVDPINKDAVNWWINTWAENYGDLADVSQNVYNTVLGKDINYTPDKFSSLDVANSKQIEEMIDSMGGGGFAGSLNYEYDKKTGVLMPSSKPVSMETGRYVNLNFDMNNSRALKAALVDINTAGATKQIKGFLKSDRWNNIIKNKEDRDLFRSRVDSYILASRNKRTATDEQALAAFERTMRAWASIGATRALGGIFQPVKQVVPVMVNTAINVGRNFSLAVTRDQYSWIDKIGMPISNRGIESMAAFEDADKEFENNVAIGAYTKAMSGIEALNKKWLKLVLSNPDVFAARSSFIAYYKQALRAKGMSANIDFTKPEDADQEALNYAQHMVDRQQNVSDAALMGDLFTSNQPLKKIIKNTLFPFMSFVINQKSRMVTDLATFSSKDVSIQEKINAFKSLSALTSEMAVFHTISFAIKYYIVNAIVGAISGEEEDEEEVEKAMKRQFGYTVGTVAKDILSPVPIATDKAVESGVDYLLDIIGKSALEDEAKLALKNENIMLEDEGEDPITGEDAKKWIEKYVEDNRVKVQSYEAQGPGGVYRIAFDKFSEIYDTYKLASEGSYESEGFAGKPITKYIDEQGREDIKEILPYYAAWSALGIPAEFGTIFRKYESKIKRDNGLTEKQKESEKEVLKEYNKEKLNDLEFALVKKLKGTTTQSGAERVIEELNWIKENGGVKGDKQIKKYIEILEANGEVMYDDLKKIQSIK